MTKYETLIKKLPSIIAQKEGKISEVKIGDIREVLAIISDLIVDNPMITAALIVNGVNRKLRRKR